VQGEGELDVTGKRHSLLRDQIRSKLARWEVQRRIGRRYYSERDFDPDRPANDEAETAIPPPTFTPQATDRFVSAGTLELFERELQQLQREGWKPVSPIERAVVGGRVFCWVRKR
jgi:hypothetical protein